MIAARRQENIVLHSFGEALSVLFVLLADKTGWLTVLFLSPLNCTGSLRPSSRPRLWNSSLSSVIVVDPDPTKQTSLMRQCHAVPCSVMQCLPQCTWNSWVLKFEADHFDFGIELN